MRAIHFVLLGSAAFGASAMAQEAGNSAGTTPAPIHFDLAAPKDPESGTPPAATTLRELTYANEAKAGEKSAPKAAAKLVSKSSAKAAPKPAPPAARKAVAARELPTAWMSPWRRAYIGKHGHQPPLPAR